MCREHGAVLIGPHRLLCGDVTTGAVGRLMGDELADVVYSDPPWGPGLLRWFYTHAKIDCQATWGSFLAAFCAAVATHRKPAAPVFVEMGHAWTDDLAAAMLAVGIAESARWRVSYGSPKRESVLWYSGAPLAGDPTGLHGRAVPMWALSRVMQACAVVLDPCCGKGTTAAVTKRLGGVFRGAELNPKRLAATQDVLKR